MNPLATTLAIASIARFVSWRQRRNGAASAGRKPAEAAAVARAPSERPAGRGLVSPPGH